MIIGQNIGKDRLNDNKTLSGHERRTDNRAWVMFDFMAIKHKRGHNCFD